MARDYEQETIDLMARVANDPLAFALSAYDWGHGELEDQELETWQKTVLGDIRDGIAANAYPIQIAVSSGHGVGKSGLAAMALDWAMSTGTDTRVVVTANTEKQLSTKTWPTLAQWRRRSITRDWFELTATALFSRAKGRERTWRADAIAWSERNPEAFAGLHNKGRRIVVIMDEGSAVPDIIWEVIEGALTDEDTQIIFLVFGNPTRNVGRFKGCFTTRRHRWKTYKVDSRTVRFTNKALIQKWLEDYGEDSDFFRVRVRGEFPRASSRQFFRGDEILEARRREVMTIPDDVVVLSLDVAREGDDNCVIAERRGLDCRSWAWETFQEPDTMETVARMNDRAQRVRREIGRWPDAIFIDSTGVGGPVADRLRSLLPDVDVIDVNFGKKVDSSVEGYRVSNMRTAIHVRLRAALPSIAIPDDDALGEEMEAITGGHANDQTSQLLDKKADIKKELGRSPDHCDALALLFTMPVEPKQVTQLSEENWAEEEGSGDWFSNWTFDD